MKLIDFDKKGNVVRFYFGVGNDYYGSDWGKVPYEHNADLVYTEFVKEILDIPFQFDVEVEEVCERFLNSPYSKEMFKKGQPFMYINNIPLTFNTEKDKLLKILEPYILKGEKE